MFIIRFFTGSIIGVISGLLVSVIVLFLVFSGLLVVLAATGGPGACTPGDGPISIDAANAAAFQSKWEALNAALNGGSPASASFTESELSSRASTYLDEVNVPLDNPRVCLRNGYGEGSATFSFLGFDAKFKIKGTLDLTGDHPKAKIESIEIGNIPGFLTGAAERFVNSAVDDALKDVQLDHQYVALLTDGQAAVAGKP